MGYHLLLPSPLSSWEEGEAPEGIQWLILDCYEDGQEGSANQVSVDYSKEEEKE